MSRAAVLPLMLVLEGEPGGRRSVDRLSQHHPRLAQHWIRAREAIGAAEDAQSPERWQTLATRKRRDVWQEEAASLRIRGGGGVGWRASGCPCRFCYQALAAVGSASWRVGQPVSWSKNALRRRGGWCLESAWMGVAAQVICCKGFAAVDDRLPHGSSRYGLACSLSLASDAMPAQRRSTGERARDGVCRWPDVTLVAILLRLLALETLGKTPPT